VQPGPAGPAGAGRTCHSAGPRGPESSFPNEPPSSPLSDCSSPLQARGGRAMTPRAPMHPAPGPGSVTVTPGARWQAAPDRTSTTHGPLMMGVPGAGAQALTASQLGMWRRREGSDRRGRCPTPPPRLRVKFPPAPSASPRLSASLTARSPSGLWRLDFRQERFRVEVRVQRTCPRRRSLLSSPGRIFTLNGVEWTI
jgi:hypothetical protein